MSDLLELEVDDEERAREAIVERKVGIVAVIADDAAHLPPVEREPLAHLQHEVLDVIEDAVFQFTLGILVYEGTFKLITREPQKMADYELTDCYYKLLEESIQRAPEFWLWSHNRWSRTREEFDRRFEVVNGKVIAKE